MILAHILNVDSEGMMVIPNIFGLKLKGLAKKILFEHFHLSDLAPEETRC
jgi:hypothetical protein